MIPKLPRTLLWTDKTTMEEFLREPINESLYDFYLELKNTRHHFGPDNSAVLLFNEIYYQLTRVEYEHNLDFNLDDYTQEIEANTGKEHSITFVYKMFFAFLLLRQNNSNVARYFQDIIFFRYNKTWDERTHRALGSIIAEDKKYQVELSPTPCDVNDLEAKDLHWDEITNIFNPSSIGEVLNLWPSKEEKIKVLRLIEASYKKLSRKSVKVENVMNFIRASDFFHRMYAELRDNDETAAIVDEDAKSREMTEEEKKRTAFLDSVGKVLKDETEQLMQKLVTAGLLTTDWQPNGLTLAERGYLADEISSRLKIKAKWKVMGALWNIGPETLRSAKNGALKTKRGGGFMDKLKEILADCQI